MPILLALLFLFVPFLQAQVTIPANASAATIQSTLNNAPAGSTVTFAPGTYNASNISVPGNKNLTVTGVKGNPGAVTIIGSSNNIFTTNNATSLTVQYLHFHNGTALYVGTGNNNNVSFVHNQVTGIHNRYGVNLDGFLSTSTTSAIQNVHNNIVIDWNQIGDVGSCSEWMAVIPDNNGTCGGITTHVGNITHLSIQHNIIYHVSEGMHINQLTNFNPGHTSAVCDYCVIDYNYIYNYHRIGMEIQVGSDYSPIDVQHNVINSPLAPFWGTFAYSMACCTTGHVQVGYSAHSPSLNFNDNVGIADTTGGTPPMGVEWWGVGAIGTNSLIQGYWGNGYSWGYGNGSWQIRNNYICGPHMAVNPSNQTGVSGSYIENEERVEPPPAQSGNVVAASCHVTLSAPVTITQSATGMTMSTSGQNTSIYYTTDGSAATVNSTLYTGPIAPATGSTVHALSMWGSGIQPKSHPAGYGYVPSSPVSMVYTGTPGTAGGGGNPLPVTPTMTNAWLTAPNNQNTGFVGGTLQFTAYASYSDGTTNVVIPSSQITQWTSNNTAVMTISQTGLGTFVGAGKATAQALLINNGGTSGWTVNVSPVIPVNPPDGGEFVINDSLKPGTYTLVVNADGTHTVTKQTSTIALPSLNSEP